MVAMLYSWLPSFMRNTGVMIALACILFIIAAMLWRSIFAESHRNRWIARHQDTNVMAEMHWHDFERLVVLVLKRWGYKVVQEGGRRADGGIDAIAYKNGQAFMVQCKRYKTNVGVSVVREMYGVMHDRAFAGVYIFTSSSFTRSSLAFAKDKPIKLVSGLLLARIIRDLDLH